MTSRNDTTLVWLRNDLRVTDNPALNAAALRGPVLPVFVWAPEEEAPWAPGAASRWWLHHSLTALSAELESLGLPLVVRAGSSLDTLRGLVKESGASAVYWNRRYEPAVIARDTRIKAALQQDGLEVTSFNGSLLIEPHEVRTKEGNPFQVFTPFWKAARQAKEVAAPASMPKGAREPRKPPKSNRIDALALLPTIPWDGGLGDTWTPGSAGARAALGGFLEAGLAGYKTDRDRPAIVGTSRMSPYLRHGELSPREVLHAVESLAAGEPHAAVGAECYIRELYWREFGYHLLFHFPQTAEEPLRERFKAFPWRHDARQLRAWQRGLTGYPLVDAGMRELWRTGWMHNRVRMNVASFLVKHLLLPWQEGAQWFWDTLVDADLANNTLGWQWAGGCGADAAPYFRVFNPILQSRKFDPKGDYIREYVPEIRGLSAEHIHTPWEAPQHACAAAGIRVGVDYPAPMVDHPAARARALVAFDTIKGGPV
jgi:deoxyribodipyrimidine photo-lyase